MKEYTNKVANYAIRIDELTREEKEYIIEGYNANARDALYKMASKKKIIPVIGKLMIKVDLDVSFWEEHYNFYKNRNLQITKLVAKVFEAFNKNDINKICIFENYGALLSSDTDIALYSSGDVDLYADVSQKSDIIKVMETFGYKANDDESNLRNIMTEFINDDETLIRISIAWKPLRRFSLPFKADTSKYFVWEEMKYYKETLIRLPSPETLLYLCYLRIAVHGYSRSPDVRLYVDTYNAIVNNPDWKKVLKWSIEDKVATKFVTVAKIANDLVKIPVPIEVLQYADKDKYCKKILNLTYDFKNHSLIYDPTGIRLLKVEAASDNKSVICEILSMLFPQKKWISEYYKNENESIVKGYLRYYKKLF